MTLANEEDQEERKAVSADEEEVDQDEDLLWIDQLRCVVVPDFSSAIGILSVL